MGEWWTESAPATLDAVKGDKGKARVRVISRVLAWGIESLIDLVP